MLMNGVGIVGWLHSLACTIGLIAGALMLMRTKGTAAHRKTGWIYVIAMLVATITTFAIYHFDIRFAPLRVGPNIFGIFHWESVATLGFLLLAVFAAPRQARAPWAYLHPASMLATYYMLVGGLINELFVRLTPLRNFATSQLHGHGNPAQSPVVGITQMLAMLGFCVLLAWFMTKVALWRRREARTAIAVAAE
jgi:uncharacterized membrane protein